MIKLLFCLFAALFVSSFSYTEDRPESIQQKPQVIAVSADVYISKKTEQFSLSINCAPRLQKSLKAIYKIPEARQLINKIYNDGPISVEVRNTTLSDEFGAFWDQENRIICIGLTPKTTEDEIITSILFELHNAAVSREIEHFDLLATRRQISRDKYIESIEYLEYCNSIKAARIANKGIQMGVLPPQARLPTYASFDEHYYYQRISGHSAWIGHTYDSLVDS